MKYILKIKNEDVHKVSLDHPDHIYADVENGLYVAESEATTFSTFEEANDNIVIFEEVVRYE